MVVPHSNYFCYGWMVNYWRIGLIYKNTQIWNDVMQILKEKGDEIKHEN